MNYGGEGGIRTHGRISPTLAFEASSFNRSDTSPRIEEFIVTEAIYSRQFVAQPIEPYGDLLGKELLACLLTAGREEGLD